VAVVLEGGGDEPGAAVLGTVSRDQAPVSVHEGAVYLHDGAAYRVRALDLEAGRARVVPDDGAVYTRASSRLDARPAAVYAERVAHGALLGHGELEVRTRVTGYRELRFRSHEAVRWAPLDFPEEVLATGGYWFSLADQTVEALRAIGRWDFDPGGERGPDWASQRALALERDGQRCRLCGLEGSDRRPLHVHHIRPFRGFGWVKGENEAWREANRLDNLISLCASCHAAAERTLGLHGGLTGLGYALGNLAPLFVMADARDLGVSTSVRMSWSGRPGVVVYERAAGGVGFGETLYEAHESILAALRAMVSDCRCAEGCPACVGPSEGGTGEAKAHVLAVLAALGAG
jgi:DEAD/DEAH box helicase domain-containing protein